VNNFSKILDDTRWKSCGNSGTDFEPDGLPLIALQNIPGKNFKTGKEENGLSPERTLEPLIDRIK
jgi:hypothetical protein